MTRLLLAALGIVVGLGLCEAICRLALCQDSLLFSEPNRFYGWRHTPDARGWAQRCVAGKPEWRAYTRINSRGLRDREIPYERTGAFRILVLGDSFTAGLQVEQEDTFAKRLEARLNGGAAAGSRIEVLNAGVSGYGNDNERLYFREEGWRYHADLVLLAFNTSNDVLEDDRALVSGSPFPYPEKPYFVLEGGRLELRDFPLPRESPVLAAVRAARRSLERHSALYRLLVTLRLRILPAAEAAPPPAAAPVSPGDVYLRTYPPEWRRAWRIVRGLVLGLAREVEARGSRFAVVVLNSHEEVKAARTLPAFDLDKPNRLITGFLARREIATIPLLEAFRAHHRTTGDAGYFRWDVHWTTVGHEVAAEAIARALRTAGLVPAAPGA